jgi:hypothetical protein
MTFSNKIAATPEFGIALFALLTNFAWELLQMPFFVHPPETSYRFVVDICSGATVADMLIMLFAFWMASLAARSRQWIADRSRRAFYVFMGTGLVITSVAELVATTQGIWSYGPRMPVVFGVGLTPFLQWIVCPLLSLWLTRLIMAGARHSR